MKIQVLIGVVALSVSVVTCAGQSSSPPNKRPVAPKIWDQQELAGWALPITGVNAPPNFYSEAEYYAAPVQEFRTYPVYHPDREPPGYMEWLRQQDPKPLVDPAEIQSDDDWVRIGRRVFAELDTGQFRTDRPDAINPVRDRELLKTSRVTMAPNGEFPVFRWVVEARGRVRLSLLECAGCHMRMEPDGTLVHGPASNIRAEPNTLALMLAQLDVKSDETDQPLPQTEQSYIQFGVPWLADDIHARMRKMTQAELQPVMSSGIGGTFARFNGSPYWTTKIPDLTGVKDRRYLDATATHRNRGPEDIARYGVLVSVADDGSIGPHKFLSDKQRKLPFRHSDEAMYALGRYIYSLESSPNPNPFDERARRGEKVFHDEGCAKCHEPPHYTNNKLTPVDGFEAPAEHPDREHIMKQSVHTEPSLALLTRKGTGVYKVPSLRGAWRSTLFEHSGSVKKLEEWFDSKRLSSDYVPSGWKGPGVKNRAVPGHEFGLDLPAEEKSDLIAFLKTL
jgi:hypothetical protein